MAIGISDIRRYSDNCRAALRQTLEANPIAFAAEFPTTSQYNSVRLLLAHSIGAEERWIERRIHGRDIVNYEERAGATVEDVYRDWEAIRDRTTAFINACGPADLARVHTISLGPSELTLTVEQMLFQIFNHETHHRAQISMALQQQGVDPPDFDYVLHHG